MKGICTCVVRIKVVEEVLVMGWPSGIVVGILTVVGGYQVHVGPRHVIVKVLSRCGAASASGSSTTREVSGRIVDGRSRNSGNARTVGKAAVLTVIITSDDCACLIPCSQGTRQRTL